MKFESQLTQFIIEYQAFLSEVSNYINPIITKPKQEIEEFMKSDEEMVKLEIQKQLFLSKFNKLPFPKNTSLTFKLYPIPEGRQLFRNKIMPIMLEYLGGWVSLNYSLEGDFTEMEKMISRFTGVPLIGNPVSEMGITFKKCPKVNFTEHSRGLKYQNGFANSSQYGYMEFSGNNSYFWSRNNKGDQKISSTLINKFKAYEVIDIKFDLASLDLGEIDAYLNHLKIDDNLLRIISRNKKYLSRTISLSF